MKRNLYLWTVMLLLASIVFAACAPAPAAPAAEAPAAEAAATEAPAAEAPAADAAAPLFIAINKSADQQYFIDLQNSFVDTAVGLGA